MIESSRALIEGLESQDMCSFLINENVMPIGAQRDAEISNCKNISNRML